MENPSKEVNMVALEGPENVRMNPTIVGLERLLSKEAKIVLPGEPGIEEYTTRWSKAAEKSPKLVVCPANSADVSQAILYCVNENVDFAVSGGGHSTSGVSSTEGVLINLDLMRGVTVNVEEKTVTVQGGARWSDVNEVTEKYGLAVVCGTIGHTGVGGLTLGGGYGFLTGEHGLVIDNLLSVEIVLANGLVVETSNTQNQDLFWALRGAGIKFGVATSFVFQAHEQKEDVWGGLLVFGMDKLAAVVSYCNKFFEDPNEKSTMLIAIAEAAGQMMVSTVVYYNGSESTAKSFYRPLLDLNPLVNQTQALSYKNMNSLLDELFSFGLRRSMKGTAFMPPLSLELVERDIDSLQQFLKETPDGSFSTLAYEFIHYGKVIQVPQDAMAFANRGAYSNILYCSGWTSPEFDQACRKWTREMASNAHMEFDRAMASKRLDDVTRAGVGEYFNYDGVGAAGKQVFGDNYDRLARLKARYDPGNVFKKGPDLSLAVNGVKKASA